MRKRVKKVSIVSKQACEKSEWAERCGASEQTKRANEWLSIKVTLSYPRDTSLIPTNFKIIGPWRHTSVPRYQRVTQKPMNRTNERKTWAVPTIDAFLVATTNANVPVERVYKVNTNSWITTIPSGSEWSEWAELVKISTWDQSTHLPLQSCTFFSSILLLRAYV